MTQAVCGEGLDSLDTCHSGDRAVRVVNLAFLLRGHAGVLLFHMYLPCVLNNFNAQH